MVYYMGCHNTCFIRYYANSIMVCPDGGMVDTKDLKSFDPKGCAGSSPVLGTN